ncbi:glutathione S-transferase [Kingella potus]|uniref:Glutathione S-transferase n=1 Tax=Kingella potus TaxID=265175 RepID=A0A377R2Q7_9NEIS|nr:glutathione S-transferase N-terminal domain-containing protein [Kingella potus]STR00581.1 glutathione S-transferase [Kingella potus]
MYTLHIGSKHISSWSLRPWLLMKVLRIPFAEALHHFIGDKTEQRRQWRAFSPSAQVPALANGGETVWDSLAIAEYLAERHPQVWPQDAAARAWARCAAAEMHSGFPVLRTVCNFTLQAAEPPCDTPGLQRELARLDALWNEGLERFGGGFLAGGGFCAADAFYAPVVLRLRCYGLAGRLNGAAAQYAERISALPELQQWISDGLEETQSGKSD